MPRKQVDPNESPEQRFKRLAEYRTQRVLESLRILSHCANRYQYGYTDNDVTKIFSAIQAEVDKTRSKFDASEKGDKFQL